jgi:hypothetical protein
VENTNTVKPGRVAGLTPVRHQVHSWVEPLIAAHARKKRAEEMCYTRGKQNGLQGRQVGPHIGKETGPRSELGCRIKERKKGAVDLLPGRA